jgi:hypothetical protein
MYMGDLFLLLIKWTVTLGIHTSNCQDVCDFDGVAILYICYQANGRDTHKILGTIVLYITQLREKIGLSCQSCGISLGHGVTLFN